MIRRFLLRLLRADAPVVLPCHVCAATKATMEAAGAGKDEIIAVLKAEIGFERALVRGLHAKMGAPVNDGVPKAPLERDRVERRPPWLNMNVGGGHLSDAARDRGEVSRRAPVGTSPAGHDSGLNS